MKTRTREAMQIDTIHVLDALIEKVQEMEKQMMILTELYLLLRDDDVEYDTIHDYNWEKTDGK